METAIITPILETDGGEYDNTVHIAVYNRSHIDNLRKFMEEAYFIRSEDSMKNQDADERMRYRASGCWSKRRNPDGSLTISVDVGCYCSHDCCGHMCGLTHTFQLVDSRLVVITNKSYNY